MKKELSLAKVSDIFADALKGIDWVKEVRLSANLTPSEHFNEVRTSSGYLATVITKDGPFEGATSIIARELCIDDEVKFESEEKVKDYFTKTVLPRLVLYFFSVTSVSIVKNATEEIKASDARISWEVNCMYTGNVETGTIFKAGGNTFMFLYPMNKESDMPVFTFICNGCAKSYTAFELSMNLSEVTNAVLEEVDDLIQDNI